VVQKINGGGGIENSNNPLKGKEFTAQARSGQTMVVAHPNGLKRLPSGSRTQFGGNST